MTFLQRFALDAHCWETKHCRNVLELDTKPLLKAQKISKRFFFVFNSSKYEQIFG